LAQQRAQIHPNSNMHTFFFNNLLKRNTKSSCSNHHFLSQVIRVVIHPSLDYPVNKSLRLLPSCLHALAFQQHHSEFILPASDRSYRWRCQTRTCIWGNPSFDSTPPFTQQFVRIFPSTLFPPYISITHKVGIDIFLKTQVLPPNLCLLL